VQGRRLSSVSPQCSALSEVACRESHSHSGAIFMLCLHICGATVQVFLENW